MLLAAGITRVLVVLCGLVGFVGLLVPHLTRGLLGATGCYNLLMCGAGRGFSLGLRPAGVPALSSRRTTGGLGHGPVEGALLRIFVLKK